MHALINLSTVSCFHYDPLTSTTSSGLIRLRPTHWSRQLPYSQVISPETAWKILQKRILHLEEERCRTDLACCAPGTAENKHGEHLQSREKVDVMMTWESWSCHQKWNKTHKQGGNFSTSLVTLKEGVWPWIPSAIVWILWDNILEDKRTSLLWVARVILKRKSCSLSQEKLKWIEWKMREKLASEVYTNLLIMKQRK